MQPTDPNKPAADDHGPMGPPPPEVIARGYEADTYENGTVLSVPLLVVLFFVLAFGTVTVLFNLIERGYAKRDPKAHPAAADRNKRPLNDRLAGISRTKEGDQPRLEPLKLRDGDARAITRPELPTGNSPELHPEDLRLSKERFPSLYAGGEGRLAYDKDLDPQALAALFPVQPDAAKLIGSQNSPSAANAGRGGEASPVLLPGPAPKLDPKKPEDKKPEDKKK